MSFDQFLKIVPYLRDHPLVLIGLCLFLVTGIGELFLRSGLLARLSQKQSFHIIRLAVHYVFGISFLIVVLGFGFGAYRARRNSPNTGSPPGPVQQQAGDCSAVQSGTGNSASVNCTDKAAGAK